MVRLVGLSTTLATNALVEDRGGRVGLVLIGMDETNLAALHFSRVRHVPGKIDISGRESQPLDIAAATAAIRELIERERAEALAVAGISSIRNPIHELAVRKLAQSVGDLPVVCGHELSQQLGAVDRANTAAHNARLLPLIRRLIDSVHAVLLERLPNAPLYIVKGDGTLMDHRRALERPIETVASGPAASAVGARTLTASESDMLVLDVGGTTSDAAMLHEGRPILRATGAEVGGRHLAFPALALSTEGLGGDSRIAVRLNHRRGKPALLALGPERAIPLCFLATQYPPVHEQLKQFLETPDKIGYHHQPGDFLVLIARHAGLPLRSNQARMLDILESEGPMHLSWLAHRADVMDSKLLGWEELVRAGLVGLAGLTPTDLWHARGDLRLWNAAAAETALTLYAQRYASGREALISDVFSLMTERLAQLVLRKALDEPERPREEDWDDAAFARRAVAETRRGGRWVQLRPRLQAPLVGLGAPAALLLPEVARVLDAELRLPEHGAVANAVGAASARIEIAASVLVKDSGVGCFTVHTPHEQAEFDNLDAAKDHARKRLREILEEMAMRAGAGRFTLDLREEDHFIQGPAHLGGTTFLRCDLVGRAIGLPKA
ncbi:hydantoinase/oxoprolinase family protein [bacterium]|nr:hydantoinase/oxoprolinase family protein [bacterium]